MPDHISNLARFENNIDNDLIIKDIEMADIRFTPTLKSESMNIIVKYKQFSIHFESLPIELQQQLKEIAMQRISKQLETEKMARSGL